MKLAFTLCSNNYLAQAKVLGDSLLANNSEYQFVIGLVDKKSPAIDYNFFKPHTIISIEEIGIPDLTGLWQKFNIIELNTAVKPSFFKYLFSKFPTVEFLLYLDPDIMVFHSFQQLRGEFRDADILLTPHIFSPIALDGDWPSENTFLNFGIYNLGFLGLANHSLITQSLLDWWEERTLSLGFIDVANGIFVDQLWMNLVPLYYGRVKILRNLGYNAAPWNLHERKIFKKGNSFVLQDGSPLVFYHFSSYDYDSPERLSKYYNRYNFDNSPELKPLYLEYQKLLLKNNVSGLSKSQCFYVEERKKFESTTAESKDPKLQPTFKKLIKLITPPIFLKLVKRLT